jgi:modulator of FtsH protease
MSIAGWEAFYAAELGAAATLGGLVFVGLSLNLKTILRHPVLPSRALVALLVILAALVISSLALIPGQSPFALGLEILASGAAAAIVCTFVELNSLRKVEAKYRRAFIGNLLVLGASVVPYLIGGGVADGRCERPLFRCRRHDHLHVQNRPRSLGAARRDFALNAAVAHPRHVGAAPRH